MRLPLNNAPIQATRKAILRLSHVLRPVRTKLVDLGLSPGRRRAIWEHPVWGPTIRGLTFAQSFLAARPLVLIMSFALVMRVYRLDLLGFNSDEAVYAGQ